MYLYYQGNLSISRRNILTQLLSNSRRWRAIGWQYSELFLTEYKIRHILAWLKSHCSQLSPMGISIAIDRENWNTDFHQSKSILWCWEEDSILIESCWFSFLFLLGCCILSGVPLSYWTNNISAYIHPLAPWFMSK